MATSDNKNGMHDSAMGWGIILICLFLTFLLFWHFFQYPIKSAFRWFRWAEMWIVSWFVGPHYTVRWNGYDINYSQLMHSIAHVPATGLDGATLNILSYVAFYPLKYVFLGLMGLMALWAMLYGPGTQYRRKMNLDGLIAAQAPNFPTISPFVKFNPKEQPPRPPGAPVPAELPAFAEALSPEEWVAYCQIPAPDGHIDEQAAFVALARQLGPRWQGALKMAPHKQILLAAFCLKAARKRDQGDDMLGRLARCWSFEGGLNLKLDRTLRQEALRVLRDRDLSEKTLAKCNAHGFETAAMLRGLLTAREEGGVLAPAQFVWLRAHDRRLWYPLNNLGRQAYHMEALGALAHFKAERMTRRPIPRPKVQEAVKSITEYMRSARARPVPPLDYSKSKTKRGVKKPAHGKKKK